MDLNERSMLSDFGMCPDVVANTVVKSIGGWLTTRILSPTSRADSLTVGTATSTARRPSLEEELGDTNVSDALTKPVDEKRMINLFTMTGY